jgi:hypothetical protein
MSDIELRLVGQDDASDDIQRVNHALGQTEKAGAEAASGSKKASVSLTDLKSGIDLTVGALRTMAEVGEKAFDFAEAGAAVRQTRESFDSLGISLNEMRGAARGTVDDMTLMGSTLTLVAGSSGEVQAAFSAAAPELLEMAKAAQKLNPTLGDVPFLYESIATAAKRQSAQIADNLGIIVKQGDAYEAYADSIGKSVNALSAEEKQIAFLNGLLDAGNVLLEQAGNSTESATDAYGRFRAEIKNMSDALKSNVDVVAGPAIGAWADLLTKTNQVRAEYGYARGTVAAFFDTLGFGNTLLDKHENALRATAVETSRLSAQAEYYAEMQADANESTYETVQAHDQYQQAIAGVESATAGAVAKQNELRDALRDAEQAALNAHSAFLDAAAGLGEMSKESLVAAQINALSQAMDEGSLSLDEFTQAKEQLLVTSGMLTEAERSGQSVIDGLTQQYINGAITAETYALRVGAVKDAVDEAADASDGGVGKISALGSSFGVAAGQADAAAGSVSGLGDAVNGLPSEKVINIMVKQQVQALGDSGLNQQEIDSLMNSGMNQFASGGYVQQTEPALVHAGEFVLNQATTRSLERRLGPLTQDKVRNGEGGGTVAPVINVYPTINTALDAEAWAMRIGEIAGQRARDRAMSVR